MQQRGALRGWRRCVVHNPRALCVCAYGAYHASQLMSLLQQSKFSEGTKPPSPQTVQPPVRGRRAAAQDTTLRRSEIAAEEESLHQPELNEMWRILQQVYPPLPVVYRPTVASAGPHVRLSLRDFSTMLIVQPRPSREADGDAAQDTSAQSLLSHPRLGGTLAPVCGLPRHCCDCRSDRVLHMSVYGDVAVTPDGLRCTQAQIWQLQRFALAFGEQLPTFVAVAESGAYASCQTSQTDTTAARAAASAVRLLQRDQCRWLTLRDTCFAAEEPSCDATKTRMSASQVALRLPCLPLGVQVWLPCLHACCCREAQTPTQSACSALRLALLQAERELASCTWFAAHAEPALSRVHRVWGGEVWGGDVAALDAAHAAVLRAIQQEATNCAALPHAWVPPYWRDAEGDVEESEDDGSQDVVLSSPPAQSWAVEVTRTWWVTPLQRLLDTRRTAGARTLHEAAGADDRDGHASVHGDAGQVTEQSGSAAEEVTEFGLMPYSCVAPGATSCDASARTATRQREYAETYFPLYHGPTGRPMLHCTIRGRRATPQPHNAPNQRGAQAAKDADVHTQARTPLPYAVTSEDKGIAKARRRLCWFDMHEIQAHHLCLSPTATTPSQRSTTGQANARQGHPAQDDAQSSVAAYEVQRTVHFTGFFLDEMPWWFVEALTTIEMGCRAAMHARAAQVLLHDYPITKSNANDDRNNAGAPAVCVLRCFEQKASRRGPQLGWMVYTCADVTINHLYKWSVVQPEQGSTRYFVDVRAALQVTCDREVPLREHTPSSAAAHTSHSIISQCIRKCCASDVNSASANSVRCSHTLHHIVDDIISATRDLWACPSHPAQLPLDDDGTRDTSSSSTNKGVIVEEANTTALDMRRMERVQRAFLQQLEVTDIKDDDDRRNERPAVDRSVHKASERIEAALMPLGHTQERSSAHSLKNEKHQNLKMALQDELRKNSRARKIRRAVIIKVGEKALPNTHVTGQSSTQCDIRPASELDVYNNDDTELGRYNRRIVPWLRYFSQRALDNNAFLAYMLPTKARYSFLSKVGNRTKNYSTLQQQPLDDIGLQHITITYVTLSVHTSQLTFTKQKR